MSEGCASAVQPAHGSSAPGCDPTRLCTNGLHQSPTWPSYMIDSPATFNRVMSWMSYKYQIQGELYWGSNAAGTFGTLAVEAATAAPCCFAPRRSTPCRAAPCRNTRTPQRCNCVRRLALHPPQQLLMVQKRPRSAPLSRGKRIFSQDRLGTHTTQS